MEAMQTPWSCEATSAVVDSATGDTTNVTVTVYDSMLAVADQSKWLDDSTKVTLEQGRGVMESNNINADISGNSSNIGLKPLSLTATFSGKNIPNSPVDLKIRADSKINLEKEILNLDSLQVSGLGLDVNG